MKHSASVSAMQPPVGGTSVQELEAFLRENVSGRQEEEEESSGGPGRPRELAGTCLWVGLLVCLLPGLHRQKAIWRVLSLAPLWGFAPCVLTPQAVYKRLDEAGSAPREQFFTQISQRLLRQVEAWLARGEREGTFTRLAPFAADILVLDETMLDQVARRLPLLRGVAKGSLLPGKLLSLFSVRTQQWRRIHFEPDSHQNEKGSARLMLTGLVSGTLLLFDRGYYCFKCFDDLTDLGFWYLSRLRARSAIQVLHRVYEQGETFDGLVCLGTKTGARPKHAVRLVCFEHQGILHRYLTNVRDPLQLRMQDSAHLYARRWDIECAFLLLKRHLGLAFLCSAKPHLLLQQVWGTLLLAHLLQALRLQIAVQARQDPFDVSLERLIASLPTLSQYPEGSLDLLLARGHELGFLRPSSRIRIQTPQESALLLLPVPLALLLEQVPTYPPDPGKTRKRSPQQRDKTRSSCRKRT